MILDFLYVFIIRVFESVLCTYRTILIVNKNKTKAFFIAFIEIIIWLIAMKTIIASDFDLLSTISYAFGFSLGTYIGVEITSRNNKSIYLKIKNVKDYSLILDKFKKYDVEVYKNIDNNYVLYLNIKFNEIDLIREKLLKINKKYKLEIIDYKRV